ncbi:hypothetical protein D3875_13420 [Deinococcus cavernae]|uniref:Uncharacterized protein n=1 Tax=Deinococcus cavernae TaxID=2320857 RepID=A0A418V8J5_9DEIO|nr:hypothetical protein [Deinococcus cavernae]RJF72401.1 hypothetical protein D3875_13420 [Deinococcus cavernae]
MTDPRPESPISPESPANTEIPASPNPREDSVVPADWPSDTPPEAQVPPPTQRGPSGDEVDDPGETSEAGQ